MVIPVALQPLISEELPPELSEKSTRPTKPPKLENCAAPEIVTSMLLSLTVTPLTVDPTTQPARSPALWMPVCWVVRTAELSSRS